MTIIDCGMAKKMNLSVLSAAAIRHLPDTRSARRSGKLYQLIRSHRTTLIFVAMRSQAEKLTRRLNERHQQETGEAEAVFAMAHHGSMSRDLRLEVEERLKQGAVPAVVATASLELGIDIGSIDLVVQVESPKSVSSGLQRVGRSGHLLHAGAQGCIIPLYPADLDDCMAMTRAMQQAAIEETTVPENCLDVLAQHIVAEVSMEPQDRAALYRLVRQSHCYRRLTEHAFNQTVEMLAGRFSDAPLTGLQPRLSWDRINDRLIGRRGSRLLAVLNSGTIPDRGYFAVVLAGERKKVGEVEEEFVFESKVGDHFFLGNSEWRIQKIDRNEIHVADQADLPRSPFWKGEPLFKNYSTCAAAGALRAKVLQQSDPVTWLQQNCHCDAAAAENLYHYLQRQLKHTGRVPTDTTVVVEQFIDATTMPHLVVHAPFGSRVTGAWAMVLAAARRISIISNFNIPLTTTACSFAFGYRPAAGRQRPVHLSLRRRSVGCCRVCPSAPCSPSAFVRTQAAASFCRDRGRANAFRCGCSGCAAPICSKPCSAILSFPSSPRPIAIACRMCLIGLRCSGCCGKSLRPRSPSITSAPSPPRPWRPD